MKFWTFIKSPSGNLAVFAGVIAVGGLMIFRSYARDQARAEQMTHVESKAPASEVESINRAGLPFKLPSTLPPRPGESDESHGTHGRTADKERGAHALPLSLFSDSRKQEADLSKVYAPYGRMIPCETVVTLESSNLDTPVVGLVTEDVWNAGQLVIPAGAEVHGRASLDRMRERIAVSGRWVVVWRDKSSLNGTELVLNGIALDRERNEVTGEFGTDDGSAGLAGQLVKSDDLQEIKLFAATFLSGMASGLQQMQDQGTAYGDVAVPVASGRNAALLGTAQVLNLYAKQIQDEIEKDGFYVRVPAGKQFYLYVTETIDRAKATRGNVRDVEVWRNDHEKN